MLGIGNSYTKVITARDEVVQDIAKISGDMNPIHLDEGYARQSKFGKRIAHALFCINGISMILGNYFTGNGTILISQTFEYKRPVYINDEIQIIVKVVNILSSNKYVLRTICKNQFGDIVLDGETVVKWENITRKLV